MAFSIASIFGGSGNSQQAATTAQPAPQQQGNMPSQPSQVASSSNPTVPQGNQQQQVTEPSQQQQQQEPQPLEAFADIWQPKVDKDGKPVVADDRVFPDFDPAKIREVVGKADFVGQIPAEILSKIEAGGKEATQAMMQIVNAASRKAYMENTLQTGKLIEAALQRQAKMFEDKLPAMLKQHSVRDNLRQSNPLFNNPAVQPIIAALEQQLAQKHPNATTSELTTMAQQYIADLGSVFSPASKATDANNTKEGETDWSKWFNG